MQRILFVVAIVVVTALMATPPIAEEPLLRPSPAILDARDEALRIAEEASQMADWLLGNDNGNDTDKSEKQATASQNNRG
jgi:hypothetical protein